MSEIKDIDVRFEKDLASYSKITADKIIFRLGRPSRKVLSAGVMDKPMKLYGSKVAKKINKHGYSINELRGLTKAVRNPIAVFKNKADKGDYSILTDLRTKNGNFLVTLKIGKGQDADFNIVSSVFGKGHSNVVRWINSGYLRYVDKKKALKYLHLAAPIAAASSIQELSSAAKIINNFKNNSISGQGFSSG